MRILERCFLYAACCAVSLSVPLSLAAQETGSKDVPANPGAQTIATSPVSNHQELVTPATEELPDSPGTEWARLQEPAQQAGVNQSGQQAAPEDKPQHPAGTAAAEAPKVTGITAAEPAGVAIAPAKQRRVRTIVLKVGAIIGAGAAIGTVVALSAGTSSKPPGAH